jgi:hypothetical protein
MCCEGVRCCEWAWHSACLGEVRRVALLPSLFSFVAAAALFITTAASAAAPLDHDRDLRRMSPRERARYEQQMRYERAQRERDMQLARERARWEAQHRYDRGPAYGYGYGRR